MLFTDARLGNCPWRKKKEGARHTKNTEESQSNFQVAASNLFPSNNDERLAGKAYNGFYFVLFIYLFIFFGFGFWLVSMLVLDWGRGTPYLPINTTRLFALTTSERAITSALCSADNTNLCPTLFLFISISTEFCARSCPTTTLSTGTFPPNRGTDGTFLACTQRRA